jgi:hypothetical protein
MFERITDSVFSGPAIVALISLGSAVLGGIISSLIPPWVNWGIEKRRNRFNARRQLIEKSRNFIETSFNQGSFAETTVYLDLQPYLSDELIKDIESTRNGILEHNRIVSLTGGDPVRRRLLGEIAALEGKWKLI